MVPVVIKRTPKFPCGTCSKIRTTKFGLQMHQRRHAGSKPYSCEFCSKTFVTSGHLSSHQRMHTGEKPFPCSVCGKSFATTRNLTAHERIHTGEKPFACDACPKSFRQQSALKAHQRTHTTSNEKVFSCTLCDGGGVAYSTWEALNRHIRVHTGEKPYRCTALNCTQRFYSSSELALHRNKLHLVGVKNASVGDHICEVCQKRLSSAHILRRHKSLFHETTAPPPTHSCQDCGKRFKTRVGLRQHAKTHSDARPEKCSFCPASFKLRTTLTVHIRRKHTGEK